MKPTFNLLKHFLNFEKIISYTLIFILSLLCLQFHIIHQAIGAESQDEPHISLKVKNQPLSDVLRKITQETGFKFELHNKWREYPVNASIEDMPLHRGLKLILQGLNHAIIYESNKSIKIMVYGKVDYRNADSSPIEAFSPQIQDNQQEAALSHESSPEETEDLKREDDSSEETGSSQETEDKSNEDEDSSDSGKEESSEETGKAIRKKLDQVSSSQSENENEQNEQENAAKEDPSESPQ